MYALEQRAHAFFRLSRATKDSRPLRAACRRSSTEAQVPANVPAEVPTDTKPYYVTTPIFYVNAAPHVGHLFTLVLADIFKRWALFRGAPKAIMLTGTDEHGMKVQRAAQKAKMDTKAFCDQNMTQFEQLARKANVSFDRFIRTTDSDHKAAVEHVWRELDHRGYIYQSKHEGWYSISDETFYPQSAVHLIRDPSTGRKMMVSIESGREVEWSSETNYHFKLSEFRTRLLEHFAEHPRFVLPESRLNQVINEVKSGVGDLSISRPTERLQWGIRVPTDDSQTIYVWLDALVNYLTQAGYPFPNGQGEGTEWPPDLHVIGKDITKFHSIYWPAFLMALDLPLPKRILSHAHWTMNNAKMSKSVGNVVNPFFAIDRFGVDAMRFYMAHDGGLVDDAHYENAFIVERYKKNLQGALGNLTTRIMRGKRWDVHSCIQKAKGLDFEAEEIGRDHARKLNKIHAQVQHCFVQLDPRAALQSIMGVLHNTNKLVAAHEVWKKVGDPSESAQREIWVIIYYAAESLRICGILLQPFMPDKMKQLLDMIGVDEARRMYEYAGFGDDLDYGIPMRKVGKGIDDSLFPPLIAET